MAKKASSSLIQKIGSVGTPQVPSTKAILNQIQPIILVTLMKFFDKVSEGIKKEKKEDRELYSIQQGIYDIDETLTIQMSGSLIKAPDVEKSDYRVRWQEAFARLLNVLQTKYPSESFISVVEEIILKSTTPKDEDENEATSEKKRETPKQKQIREEAEAAAKADRDMLTVLGATIDSIEKKTKSKLVAELGKNAVASGAINLDSLRVNVLAKKVAQRVG